MTLQVNDNGTWKEPTALHVNDNGTWKEVQTGFINDAGAWKEMYTKTSGSVVTIWKYGYRQPKDIKDGECDINVHTQALTNMDPLYKCNSSADATFELEYSESFNHYVNYDTGVDIYHLHEIHWEDDSAGTTTMLMYIDNNDFSLVSGDLVGMWTIVDGITYYMDEGTVSDSLDKVRVFWTNPAQGIPAFDTNGTAVSFLMGGD